MALLYSNTALFRRLETLALDFTMLAREPKGSSDVVIVRITDNDYQEYFGGKSPLDPAALSKIITMIASGKPKVIGVDLDTSSKGFESLKVLPDWPPVIWARDAKHSNVQRKYLLSGALGSNAPFVPYGLVTLKLDADGAIRRYARWYDTDVGPAPSLPWAMLRKFRNDESPAVAAPNFQEEFLINYAGPAQSEHFFRPPVSMIDDLSRREGWRENNFLKDKMVILGGDYAVQDEHDTPVGWMIGAEILASITETERQGGGHKPIGTAAIILLAVFDSIVLLFLIHIFGLGKTLLVSIIVIPIMALLCSLLFFGSASYAGTFLLILITVLLHQTYEKGKEYLKKWREQAADQLK